LVLSAPKLSGKRDAGFEHLAILIGSPDPAAGDAVASRSAWSVSSVSSASSSCSVSRASYSEERPNSARR
jgi:hypothetical protein